MEEKPIFTHFVYLLVMWLTDWQIQRERERERGFDSVNIYGHVKQMSATTLERFFQNSNRDKNQKLEEESFS